MTLTAESRSKISDIVYELNVDRDQIDAVVDQIVAAIGPVGITIDLAGAMEKITPAMMDAVKDTMIEVLTERANQMQKALQPFANCIFNDNGDVTLSNTHRLTTQDFLQAHHAHKGPPVGETAWVPAKVTPAEGTVASVFFRYRWGLATQYVNNLCENVCTEVAHGAIFRDGRWSWNSMRVTDKVLSYHVIPDAPQVA